MLISFLRAILPEEGVKCWTSIQNKKAVNHFCTSIAELAAQIVANDAAGIDTYHACATFKTAQSRRAANAGCIKICMADIDVGDSKPYATVQDAISACDEFCSGLAIPIPGLVASGTGLHAYWVLDRVLDSAEWVPLAQRFKLLMQAKNFHCDPSRTADIASILRPPGTKNYKNPAAPRLVTIIDPDDFDNLFAPISCEQFTSAIVNCQYAPIAKSINTASVNANFSAGIASKAFDFTVGVKQGSRGSMRVRYAGELVAKGYVYEDVLQRVRAWDQMCEPPEGEEGVLHSVRSAFNMHAAKHPQAATTPQASAPAASAALPDALPPCPWGYKWGNANQLMVGVPLKGPDGKAMKDEAGKTVLDWEVVSNLPVYMEAWLNEEGHDQKNAYLFRAFHPQKGWQSFHMSAAAFNGEKCYAELVMNGVSLIDGMDKAFKTYVRRAENMLRLPGQEQIQYSQFGWKDTPAGPNTAFVVGNKVCHADGRVENAVGSDKLTPLMQAMQRARSGSLLNWSVAANKLGMPGLEPHLFMVTASFASALMRFCVDEGNGGSIISIVSEESGHGKTPMATAMASVWGTLPSIVSTGNFTGNRLIDDVVRRCNIVQVQEEMHYSDPIITAEGVKKFTSGSDRGRLDQSGNSKGIPQRYQTMLVSISNKSLYEMVKLVDIPMACRVFEIEIERPDKDLLANLGGIAREMMSNCGYAGLDFARIIVEPNVNQYIREHLTGNNMGLAGTTIMKYRGILNSKPEHRFVVWAVACVEVAALIINHYGIMTFDANRLMSWVTQQAKMYTVTDESDLAAMKLDAFIREHINACVTVQGPYDPRLGPQISMREPSGSKLYMRMELKTNKLYIATEPLKQWCTQHGMSFIGLGKKLRKEGLLLNTSKAITLGAGTNIVSGRALCWEIDTAHHFVSNSSREELTANVTGKVVAIKP